MTAQSPARLTSPPAVRGQLPLTPGRWLALFIGVPVLLALIGFTGLNVVALAGQGSYRVRDTIPVRDGQITARINSGDVTLQQAAAGAAQGRNAELTGTAHYSLFRQRIRISGSTLTYTCGFALGNCSLNATLQVPARTAVSLFTFGGDVTIPSFTDSRLTGNTDGGNLTAGNLDGNLNLSTGGGDLTASAIDGPVNVNTDGGNLTVGTMRAPTASIHSGGGDVFLAYATVPGGIQINSDGGNVTLVLPRAEYADYQVYVNADGGSVTNQPPDDHSATKSITVDSGGGNITFREAS